MNTDWTTIYTPDCISENFRNQLRDYSTSGKCKAKSFIIVGRKAHWLNLILLLTQHSIGLIKKKFPTYGCSFSWERRIKYVISILPKGLFFVSPNSWSTYNTHGCLWPCWKPMTCCSTRDCNTPGGAPESKQANLCSSEITHTQRKQQQKGFGRTPEFLARLIGEDLFCTKLIYKE